MAEARGGGRGPPTGPSTGCSRDPTGLGTCQMDEIFVGTHSHRVSKCHVGPADPVADPVQEWALYNETVTSFAQIQ